MNSGVWQYSMLIVAAMACLGLAYRKQRTASVFVFFLAAMGVTLIFDYLIYVIGHAYTYRPGFIQGKYDTYIGALVNSVILSSVAAFFAAWQLRWIWSIVLAALFAGIELLFLKQGIFVQNWWSTWFTFVTLCFYFPVNKGWWNKLNRWHGASLTFATLVSSVYAVRVPLGIMMYSVLNSRSYHAVWFERHDIDSSACNTAITASLGIAITWLYLRTRTAPIERKVLSAILVIVCSYVVNQFLVMQGVIRIHSRWDAVFYITADTLTLLLAFYMGGLLTQVMAGKRELA